MKNNKLAIVIPAYKSNFLNLTLESIANQTCRNFVLYVGDDNSAENLFDIVKEFENRIDIVYKKFDDNLGRNNLTLQWTRCVDLINDEEWVWLFSDDDIMQKDCVEVFFNTLFITNSKFDLYRFNTEIINEEGKVVGVNEIKSVISAQKFIKSRLLYKHGSYAVEYIFKVSRYKEINGFVNFPKAWCSDDATWFLISKDKGIYSMKKGIVKWRYSNVNISGSATANVDDLFTATNLYSKWIYIALSDFFTNKYQLKILIFNWYHLQLYTIGIVKSLNDYSKTNLFFSKVYFVKSFWIYNFTSKILIRFPFLRFFLGI